MSRKQIRITTPVAQAAPAPGDAESWVGRIGPSAPSAGGDASAPAELWLDFAQRIGSCRTPRDVLDLQLWVMRAQMGWGLDAAGRYAKSAGDAFQAAATALSPRS